MCWRELGAVMCWDGSAALLRAPCFPEAQRELPRVVCDFSRLIRPLEAALKATRIRSNFEYSVASDSQIQKLRTDAGVPGASAVGHRQKKITNTVII